ncbi:MAG: hypothetical protein JST53_00885 [Actinobacteria bacterium]|nr:hypothetical protein [Actinomycetota bacterium]
MKDEVADAGWLRPSPPACLNGSESFRGGGSTVGDFWAWAFSDLRDNTIRGALAEFIVAKAVGDERPLRIGWDNYDVVSPEGTTIEVKCSAYLQSWAQRRHSDLSFGRMSAREFDASTNSYSEDRRVRADVFVFAVQSQRDPEAYDPLDLSHWQFWAVTGAVVRERAARSVGIRWVRDNGTGPHSFDGLREAVRAAGA